MKINGGKNNHLCHYVDGSIRVSDRRLNEGCRSALVLHETTLN